MRKERKWAPQSGYNLAQSATVGHSRPQSEQTTMMHGQVIGELGFV